MKATKLEQASPGYESFNLSTSFICLLFVALVSRALS